MIEANKGKRYTAIQYIKQICKLKFERKMSICHKIRFKK